MFCSKCGNEVKEEIRFCPKCGNPVKNASQNNVEKIETTGQTASAPREAVGKNPYAISQSANDLDGEPVVSTWSFLGYRILELIPFVGFIVMIVFAVDKSKKIRANYARAYFLIFVIQILLIVLFYSSIVGFLLSLS